MKSANGAPLVIIRFSCVPLMFWKSGSHFEFCSFFEVLGLRRTNASAWVHESDVTSGSFDYELANTFLKITLAVNQAIAR
jgi:hypothetical protein